MRAWTGTRGRGQGSEGGAASGEAPAKHAAKLHARSAPQPFLSLPSPCPRSQVVDMVTRGIFINMVGLAATLTGVQALVGMLVAKTLQVRGLLPRAGGTPGLGRGWAGCMAAMQGRHVVGHEPRGSRYLFVASLAFLQCGCPHPRRGMANAIAPVGACAWRPVPQLRCPCTSRP